MTFDADAVAREADLEPFEFTLDGQTFQLPHMKRVSARMAVQIDSGDLEVLTRLDKTAADAVLDAPGFVANAIMEAWMKHAGHQPGESPASTGSS